MVLRMSFGHALDIEFLNGNHTETVDKPPCRLVNEVMPAVLDALMHTPNDFLGGLALFRAVLVFNFVELALGFGECFFFLTEEAWVLNELAILPELRAEDLEEYALQNEKTISEKPP